MVTAERDWPFEPVQCGGCDENVMVFVDGDRDEVCQCGEVVAHG